MRLKWGRKQNPSEANAQGSEQQSVYSSATGSSAPILRRKRRKNWFRRTIEIGQLQVQQDDKLKWLEEAYRQMGERLVDHGFPEEDEFQAWLHFVRELRTEIVWIQSRIVELENPGEEAESNEETRPITMIAGGAVASQGESKGAQQRAQEAPSDSNILDSDDGRLLDQTQVTPAAEGGVSMKEHSHYEILNPISEDVKSEP